MKFNLQLHFNDLEKCFLKICPKNVIIQNELEIAENIFLLNLE